MLGNLAFAILLLATSSHQLSQGPCPTHPLHTVHVDINKWAGDLYVNVETHNEDARCQWVSRRTGFENGSVVLRDHFKLIEKNNERATEVEGIYVSKGYYTFEKEVIPGRITTFHAYFLHYDPPNLDCHIVCTHDPYFHDVHHGYGYDHGVDYYPHHAEPHYPHHHEPHHYDALKALLVPLAGVALLGAAAIFASNPILLQLGVVHGKRRRRQIGERQLEDLLMLEKFISQLPTAEVEQQNRRLLATYLSCSGGCVERVACEVQQVGAPEDKHILNMIVSEIIDNEFVNKQLKKSIFKARKTGHSTGLCKEYPCPELDKLRDSVTKQKNLNSEI